MTQASDLEIAAQAAEWNGLFGRIGSELRMLAQAVSDMQHVLTPLVTELNARDPTVITRLQKLDLIEQSLQGLSGFMSCLDASTALTDFGAVSEGVKTIRLAGMAERLSPARDESTGKMAVSTEFELF